jgi:hypothetical protein
VKSCLIVGCAENLWNDVAQALEIGEFDATYCVKLAGVHWPAKFQVWVTLHPERMGFMEDDRHKLGFPNGYEIVAPLKTEAPAYAYGVRTIRQVSFKYNELTRSPSSGIFAVKVAIDDGFDRIVLAGVPLDTSKHFQRMEPWREADAYMHGFKDYQPHFAGKVRSMSGRTREALGFPTAAWLAGDE